eukprot:CAMPEP_0118693054 /NCGR_PEP_ID=MMETSP0800-20121206/11678_1 /TAXON_ID=210618 ORGANISM="Striatella unipunctata, Strain CCMP2910" /NCGR_SAMPLE_ID=MMETSP0800 /ASSEMBLY_ACC=CAM_ASM_000638 /LENGTH=115 /DNA_ID=CAMNT_0006591213 /DNA_START=774 /DNA_END=1121 /DNA_ORIENTATION=-
MERSQDFQKLIDVAFDGVFHEKVIDYKTEGYWFVSVLSEARCVTRRVEALLFKSLLKLLIGRDTSLWESVHFVCDLEVDPSIGCEVMELVEFDDLAGASLSSMRRYSGSFMRVPR